MRGLQLWCSSVVGSDILVFSDLAKGGELCASKIPSEVVWSNGYILCFLKES